MSAMELLEWLILAESPLVLFFQSVLHEVPVIQPYCCSYFFSEIKSGNRPTARACRYIGSPNVYYSNQR